MTRIIFAALLVVGVSACAYHPEIASAPAVNVVTSYSTKVKGKWLAFVDAAALQEVAKTEGLACSAHNFPVDLSQVFASSVRQTLPNIIENPDVRDTSVDAETAVRSGAHGVINFRGESVRSRLTVVPGFWQATLRAEVTITVAVTADGKGGRLFGKTFEGTGRANAESGIACEGGAKALRMASEDAQRDLLRRVAEDLANSDRMRGRVAASQ